MIIALHGKKRTGKDTVATMLKASLVATYAINESHIVTLAFADKLKEIAAVETGIPLEAFYDGRKDTESFGKHGTPRDVMLEYHYLIKNRFGEDYLARHAVEKVEYLRKTGAEVFIITDMRLPVEECLMRKLKAKIVHVLRDTGIHSDHPSERGLPIVQGDHLIKNDGTLLELGGKVDKLAVKLVCI